MKTRRHLPHWFPEGRSIFLTWRLYGSIPVERIARVRQNAKGSGGERFKEFDDMLDGAHMGPMWLADSTIAEMIIRSCVRGADELQQYRLDAYVVMSNHIHLLITPSIAVPRLMNSLKTVTAKAANAHLGRTGMRFWQNESYDHWCRDQLECRNIRRYIENNPVKAKLVARPEDWPWSSASRIAALAVR
jgi:putative transposase